MVVEGRLKHEPTTAENSDVIDFKQECKPVLVDKFFLHDASAAESEPLRSYIQEFSMLNIIHTFRIYRIESTHLVS